ncbi:hypothetical protein RchiOBHm_Chr3g0492121 [Rosa chinensis]|uniref:Uncharacterized protein n=1 Tax=Rosa chinensis TaxID=74649 RepID=A0A2P6RGE5_ROSCH|nr:hypothetical protein RchiOBHm_Chr3g0492121 [Rosa chinensis]
MDASGITVRPAVGKEKEKYSEEDLKAAARVIKKEGWQICGDDHQHIISCPYLECVPPGATVGPDYLVICDLCGYELLQPTAAHCWMCGKWGVRAVEASTFDESYRNHLEEDYIAEPIVYAGYIDLDKTKSQTLKIT